jgi:DNA mismatch repair protein MutS2
MVELSRPIAVPPSVLRIADDGLVSLSLLDVDASEPPDDLHEALVFAFATGDGGDALDRAVAQAKLPKSLWSLEEFASDVFLHELIDRCFPVVALGQTLPRSGALLYRILSQPPADARVTRFRQDVLVELLSHDGLRMRAEQLLSSLARFRGMLSNKAGVRADAIERRLSILRAYRDVVLLACAGFSGLSSGLSRIDAWGKATAREPAFTRLVELLAYEEGTAEIDVRLRLGFDGKIRDFEVLGRRVPTDNAFHRTPLQKLMTKVGMFLRGERWGDHELLARLVDDVFDGVLPLLPPLFTLAAGLELYVAALAFRDIAHKAGLPVTLASFTPHGGHELGRLWNPLLLSPKGGRVVPCDLDITAPSSRVIVTGPNSGGKTRLLQAIALTQMLAQAGLFVPAERAKLPVATGLFVSLLEHARADQAEGRLGTELVRIRRLFESLRAGSLVIMDELCAGTNPDEGEDIFRLVVKLLAELEPAAFITTHFLRFAARLEAEKGQGGLSEGLAFLRVELDEKEQPTYQFVPGVATSSLAHRTAERLGVTENALRKAIRARNGG